MIAGRLTQSDFSPTTVASGNRWASAIALVFLPHGADGLELGFTRFIEGPSERGIPTPARIARLFSTGLSGKAERTGLNDALENQLASVFARWTFPRAGVEVYGEYLREDYSFDFRRFLQYPDDYGSYVFGLQRVLVNKPGALRVLRVEFMNAEPRPPTAANAATSSTAPCTAPAALRPLRRGTRAHESGTVPWLARGIRRCGVARHRRSRRHARPSFVQSRADFTPRLAPGRGGFSRSASGRAMGAAGQVQVAIEVDHRLD